MLRAGAIAALIAVSSWAAAQDKPITLKPGYPERYTVQKGDTLWGIAGKFLQDPWRWPEVWQRNQDIQNPHLIFPGDVLVLRVVDGKPQVSALPQRKLSKLVPTVHAKPREDAIPTIPPSAIQAFLDQPLVVDPHGLDDMGYVAVGLEGRLALGKYSLFYGRGIKDESVKSYQIFRPGKQYIDPNTSELLGVQAIHVGDAHVIAPGESAKMEVTRSHLEISPGDRLVPAPKNLGFPYYEPRPPSREVRGLILDAPRGVAEVGPLSVVVLNLGKRDEIEPGHVLRIMRKEKLQKDPVTKEMFQPPLEQTGVLMVFRTFEKVSYALILHATNAIHLKDVVETP